MKAPVVEINEDQYCIRLDKRYVSINTLQQLVARLHSRHEVGVAGERHFDDLQTKMAVGNDAELWDRLEDK